jgi:hypothetical protein
MRICGPQDGKTGAAIHFFFVVYGESLMGHENDSTTHG